MEKMFGPMMQGFFSGMSEADRQKMTDCFEKMAALCPCGPMTAMPDGDQTAVQGKMMSCCGSMMGMMSSAGKCTAPLK